MLINENGTVIVFRGESRDTLPALPRGHVYASAQFSPSGERLAFFSTDQKGSYTVHVYLKADRSLAVPVPGGPSYGPAWTSDDALVFTASEPRATLVTYRLMLR
jgi:hypothetical protein